jgi:predicted nucleic acid-binding protein
VEPREIESFAAYSRIFGAGPRDLGEAATLAWAEEHGATPVMDDQTAVNAARARDVPVRRTLALVADGVRRHILFEPAAATLVDELIAGGARFPCSGSDFVAWARSRGILGPP